MRLAGGAATAPHRATWNRICLVVNGAGRSTVGDRTFEWSRHDVFTIPHWTWATHAARGGDADFFIVSDHAVFEAMGLLREERRWVKDGIGARLLRRAACRRRCGCSTPSASTTWRCPARRSACGARSGIAPRLVDRRVELFVVQAARQRVDHGTGDWVHAAARRDASELVAKAPGLGIDGVCSCAFASFHTSTAGHVVTVGSPA